MKLIETSIPDVIVIEPQLYRDDRGFFLESYHYEKYAAQGITPVFVQDNHSRSVRGTVRGLHAQLKHPQGKLVRVIEGEIFDVAVDIRRGSPTFGKWVGAWLSSENFRQIYIPIGFAHGFCVTSEIAQVEYKCTDYYDPSGELSIQWNDQDLNVDWPFEEIGAPILSRKDVTAKPLRELMDVLPWIEEK